MSEIVRESWRFKAGDTVRLRGDPASRAVVLHGAVFAGELGWYALKGDEPDGGYSVVMLPDDELEETES